MAMLRFGPNELNPASFELKRANRKIKLAARPMELLLFLIERRGELVTRAEIAKRVWQGMDAEELEARINTAVAQIRSALNEEAAKPRYLETVIGKGYRFVAAVEEITVTEPVAAAFASGSGPIKADMPERFAVFSQSEVGLPKAQPGAPQIRPATRPRTWVTVAAFVALVTAVIVTSLPWSRWLPSAAEPKAQPMDLQQITDNLSENPVEAAALTPDGRLLAYADGKGVWLREIKTGNTRLLKAPTLRASQLAWFADQTRFVETGFATERGRSEIWLVSAAGGEPRLLRIAAKNGVPSPDGRSVAFTVNDQREIRLANTDGTGERALALSKAGEVFSALFWPANGRRISYQQCNPSQPRIAGTDGVSSVATAYECSYGSSDIQTGGQTAAASKIFFHSAVEMKDGQILYLAYSGNASTDGIWKMPTDPSTGRPLAAPRRISSWPWQSEALISLGVSADGRTMAVMRQRFHRTIFVGKLGNAGLQAIQRLTGDFADDYPHGWDAASNAVYFESYRVSALGHLFRQQIGSTKAQMLTAGDKEQIFPAMMPGGKTLVYEERAGKSPHLIVRANADGTGAKRVWTESYSDQWRCPLTSGRTCVLRETRGNEKFVFYVLDLDSGKGRELAQTNWMPAVVGDWALSPDGRIAAIPNHDPQAPSIQLVPLNGTRGGSEIKVRSPGQVWGISWSVDAKGFFAELRLGRTNQLAFINLAGEVRVLRETRGSSWGVPSPDGKKLAFLDTELSQNVYMWDR